MSRELRRVAADWQHPTSTTDGSGYVPLRRPLAEQQLWWDYGHKRWQEGVMTVAAWTLGADTLCFEAPHKETPDEATYTAAAGPRPTNDGTYMPDWTKEQATHWQLYEKVSEGTPLTPPFATIEELAAYCVKNDVCAGVSCAPGEMVRNITYNEKSWLALFQDSVRGYVDWMRRIENDLPLHPMPGSERAPTRRTGRLTTRERGRTAQL